MAKLFFRYAAMNSGKSTQLLQIANNYESMAKTVRLYTAAIDDRFGVGKITSRLNIQRDALTYDDHFDFLAADYAGIACVLAVLGNFEALVLISGGAICLVYVLVGAAAGRAQAGLALAQPGHPP